MLLKANNSYDAKAFTSLPDLRTISQQGTLTPDHIIHTKRLPAIVDDLAKSEEAISAYKDDYVK
jgi:rhamnose utilization protein RhaD (predicted bifunctional aldolase and dehydrogenase)